MLLYTKRAAPKVPKRRSRGGCTYCKEKKKKCDEERPACGRCLERSIECTYEAVKPRQRRKRDSIASDSLSTGGTTPGPGRTWADGSQDSDDSHDEAISRPDWPANDGYRFLHEPDDAAVFSPVDSSFDTASLMSFSLPSLGAAPPFRPVLYETREPEERDKAREPSQAVLRRHSMAGPPVAAPRSQIPDLAMISPSPLRSPLLDFSFPVFSEFSNRPNRRALVDHFCNVLSHLIVFREESGNPFQQLVLPLTKRDSPVTNAVFALASAHLEYRGVENPEKSVYFHNQAIQGLAKQIEYGGTVERNEVLAAIILLIYYEVLVQKGRSNIVDGHLKGALTIMCTNPEPSNPTSVFLERAFRFYDVIAALSNGTAPLSVAPGTGCLLPLSPLGAPESSSMSNVDTLLGMATTLWPVIHRLSNMLPLKLELEAALQAHAAPSKIAVLRTEFESTAQAIETALLNWHPSIPARFTYDEETSDLIMKQPDRLTSPDDAQAGDAAAEHHRIHSILHNALAYRHSAFVYLYRTIFSWPRAHAHVQKHVHQSLTHCVRTTAYGGPMGALLWPLFVAACEATGPADRALAQQAFAAVKVRQGMMNIERAWDIVQEVWRRADQDEACAGPAEAGRGLGIEALKVPGAAAGRCGSVDLWRQVSAEMGVHIVFG